jgi:hypothetical protein
MYEHPLSIIGNHLMKGTNISCKQVSEYVSHFSKTKGDTLMTNKLNLHIDDLLSYTDDISTL